MRLQNKSGCEHHESVSCLQEECQNEGRGDPGISRQIRSDRRFEPMEDPTPQNGAEELERLV